MSIWHMLDSMTKWEVRNGQTIKVWSDCWVDKGIRFIDYMAIPIGNWDHASLATIMTRSGNWN